MPHHHAGAAVLRVALGALLLALLVAGGATVLAAARPSGSARPDVARELRAARRFREFGLYYAGRRFDGLPLTGVLIARPAPFPDPGAGPPLSGPSVTFIYGDCAPSGSERSCAPPLEIQVSSACDRYAALYPKLAGPVRTVLVRGVPAGVFAGSVGSGRARQPFDRLELYTGRVTIVIFGRRSLAAAKRVAVALRRLHDRAASRQDLPPPVPGALQGHLRGCPETPLGVGEHSQLFLFEPDHSRFRRLTHSRGESWRPAWSADGQRLTFARQTRPGLAFLSISADGSDTRTVLSAVALRERRLRAPVISPDGTRIAYLRPHRTTPQTIRVPGLPQPITVKSSQADLYVANIDGSGERRLTRTPENETAPTWSPDGNVLLTLRVPSASTLSLWRIPVDGAAPRRILRDVVAAEPSWSPDSRQIAFTGVLRRRGPRYHLFVIDRDGTGLRTLVRVVGSTRPTWSRDGATIAYSTGEAVHTVPSNGGRTSFVFNLPPAAVTDLAWSPDGLHIAFAARRPPPED